MKCQFPLVLTTTNKSLPNTSQILMFIVLLSCLYVSVLFCFCHEQLFVQLIKVVFNCELKSNTKQPTISNHFNYIASNMIDIIHMVLFVSILLVAIFVHTSHALIPDAVGKFPFLMPNVHPYRVSKSKTIH